jgi:hypothetical protein
LPIPEGPDGFHDDSGGWADRIAKEGWPLEKHVPLWALAQHHGLPTRLLDWTRSFVVAAFFAARQALDQPSKGPSPDLVVWACQSGKRFLFDDEIPLVQRLPLPSPNLARQSGLFTLHRVRPQVSDDLEALLSQRRCLEELVRSRPLGGTPLVKHVLRKTEAKNLMLRCEMFGVTAATMFPGYDGAVKATLDRMMLDPVM